MNLPQTLHGQLFLLAYDRRRQTFDGDKRWCFGLALRAAMLSDLYLTGHLEDKENDDGARYPVGVTRPDDPVLRAVFDEIRDEPGKSWAQVVARNSQSEASEVVRSPARDRRVAVGAAAPSAGRHSHRSSCAAR